MMGGNHMTNALRKTSGRYRLVFLNEKWKKETIIDCDTLTGKILPAKKQKITGADLPILDMYILNHFKNEESLRRFVQKLGYPITEDDTPRFSYQHNGMTNYLELVYQNEELYELAILCSQYKKRFTEYAYEHKLSSKELRKLISKEISHETLWKNFYDRIISALHKPDFFKYIIEEPLLGDRIINFIVDYLNNEACINEDQREAFYSARYYLIDTFTAYKPIRGMIVSEINYVKTITPFSPIAQTHKNDKKACYFGYTRPFHLISESKLCYLESQPYFCSLSKEKQEDMILGLLGLKEIPWYKQTLHPLSELQITSLEAIPYFNGLTYLEKIKYANDSIFHVNNKETEQFTYQKQIS